jgi:flagellar hook-basal body complex protein FliE
MFGRVPLVAAVLIFCAALFASACGEPPTREMDQAQGAIDAARAAGADRYATEEYQAAVDALKQAQDAVEQRDYRLALNHALDSRERAQNAAKETGDNKAIARGDAEHALSDVMAALNDAHTKLKAAETARVPSRTLAEPRQTIADGDTAVQKARALFKDGDYLSVIDMARPVAARLRETQHALDRVVAPAPRRRR